MLLRIIDNCCCVTMLAAALVLIFLSQTPVEASTKRPYCGSGNTANQCCEALEDLNEKLEAQNEKSEALNEKLEDLNEKLEAQNEKLEDLNEKLDAQNEKLKDSKLVQLESLKIIKDLQVRYVLILRSDRISCFILLINKNNNWSPFCETYKF